MKREFLTKEEVLSDPRYGTYPGARDLKEKLQRGILILDKPKGPTSHQTTAWVKDILDLDKAGHSGTLDPKTSGVLLVALKKSTKTMPVLKGLDKEYVATMTLHDEASDDVLEETLQKFRGKIKQVPPKKSAVKREERTREVYKLKVLDRMESDVLLRIKCEAGTYVRKIIHDLGEEMGCKAHMKELRRTAVGPFGEEESVKLQDIKDSYVFYEDGKSREIEEYVLPVEVVADLSKAVVVKDTAVESVCNGAPLGVGGIAKLEKDIEEGDAVSLLSGKGELVALGEAEMSSENMYERNGGKAASLINVIMDRGTYPKGWK